MKFKEALKFNWWKTILTIVSIPIFWQIYFKIGLITGIITVDIICGGGCGEYYRGGNKIFILTLLTSILVYLGISYYEYKKLNKK